VDSVRVPKPLPTVPEAKTYKTGAYCPHCFIPVGYPYEGMVQEVELDSIDALWSVWTCGDCGKQFKIKTCEVALEEGTYKVFDPSK
jgi:hypothetical protein